MAITIGITECPPSVIFDGNENKGFEVDIVNDIAARKNLDIKWIRADFPTTLKYVKEGTVEAAIGAITIDYEREKYMNFSRPTLDDGIGAITVGRKKTKLEIWIEIIQKLKNAIYIVVISIFVLWISEMKDNSNIRNDYRGIGDAAWVVWAVITTVGFGDKTPKTWTGKIVVAIVSFILIGVAFPTIIEIFSSNMTSELITDIKTVEDLNGKKVAAEEDTTSSRFLDDNLDPTFISHVPSLESALALLEAGKIDVVMGDHCTLKYYYNKMNQEKYILLPEIFRKESHGIAFYQESTLLEEFNQDLHLLIEDGTYDRIYQKWFGRN